MWKEMHRTRNLFRYWWVSLVVGILSIVTGVCCFVVPADSLAVMTTFFIAVLVTAGIVNVLWAFANREWGLEPGPGAARGPFRRVAPVDAAAARRDSADLCRRILDAVPLRAGYL